MAKGTINKVIILGRLGQDPEMKSTAAGLSVVNINVATNSISGQGDNRKEDTEWHRVTLFGKLAETTSQYLRKGGLVYIEGRIQTRKWQDQNGQDRYSTDIIANEMQMIGGKGDNPGNNQQDWGNQDSGQQWGGNQDPGYGHNEPQQNQWQNQAPSNNQYAAPQQAPMQAPPQNRQPAPPPMQQQPMQPPRQQPPVPPQQPPAPQQGYQQPAAQPQGQRPPSQPAPDQNWDDDIPF